jgi:AcrR family transcriptional regulator
MGKRGPHRDLELRRQILDATRELICAQGPLRVSVNQIAAAAGVGKQTIYRWWPSKSGLVIDALEDMFEAETPFPDTGSARDDLAIQMRRVAATFASPTGSIIRELVAESQADVTVAAAFRERFFSERRRRAAMALQAGVARGELRQDLDLEVAIDLLYAPLWLRMLIGHQPLSQVSADLILEQVWPAIAVPEPAPLAPRR